MADSNLTGLTERTTPLGSDLRYGVYSGTTDFKMYDGTYNLLPDGFMINGVISVTVATNNITVALKTRSGGNPSATDPVSIWINGSFRRCTAALSVTKNAGTNWFNAGAAELATLEQDYFAYLIWNTTPATDIMDIGFARAPYFTVYSEASGTTTSEKYLANGNGSAPTSTDSCVVIGRFAATLSASASYNWSVPTYTNTNLIQYPIYNTRVLTYAPTIAGFSANPSTTVYRYQIKYDRLRVDLNQGVNGTSNATTFTMTAPMAHVTLANSFTAVACYGPVDNGTVQTTPAFASLASGASTINVYKNADAGTTAWTNVNGKRVAHIGLDYPLK